MSPPYRKLWYQKFEWGLFFTDTMHLNGWETGVYALLIGNYFCNRGPLPDDDRRLANMVRLKIDEWKEVRPAMEGFFEIRDGQWRHWRIDQDLAQKAAEAKGKSAGARRANAVRKAQESVQNPPGNRTETHPQLQSQSQLQSESESELKREVKTLSNGVENDREVPDEEELLRRTREVVGPQVMEGRNTSHPHR